MTHATIRETFGLPNTNGDIGIEVEVEGERLPGERSDMPYFKRFWRFEADGSLRGNSIEYVLKKPCSIDRVDTVLNMLDKAYRRAGATINDSVRAGVHIHVNVQELTHVQMYTFASCYIMIEELMLAFCRKSRQGNHFCLRSGDAEYLIYQVTRAIEDDNLNALSGNNIRYASLNFTALCKYGSLEFRALEGTRDLDKIATWAKMLYQIKKASLKFNNPHKVLERLDKIGPTKFAKLMLGEFFSEFSQVNGIDELVMNNIKHLHNIAYSTADWTTIGTNVQPRSRRLNSVERSLGSILEQVSSNLVDSPPTPSPNPYYWTATPPIFSEE